MTVLSLPNSHRPPENRDTQVVSIVGAGKIAEEAR